MISTRYLNLSCSLCLLLLLMLPTVVSGQPKGDAYEHLVRQWNELYSTILKEKKEVQKKFRIATNAQFKAGEDLRTAEANKKILEPYMLANLHEVYDRTINNLKYAKKHQKDINALAEKATKVNAQTDQMTEKKISKIRSSYQLFLAEYDPSRDPVTITAPPPPPPPVPQKTETPYTAPTQKTEPEAAISAATATNPSSSTVAPEMVDKRPQQYKQEAYMSKPYVCSFEIDTLDSSSGMRKVENSPGVLFTYTDPDLRPHFKNKDLIKCLGRLSMFGPYYYLTIEFQIASSHSQNNFGSLQEGSLLRFKLMNEEYISLYNIKTNTGRIDPYSGHTIFSGQYAIGKQELNKFSKSSLDKMRIMWSTGFEDYDVYHIDFLKDQINCLNEKS